MKQGRKEGEVALAVGVSLSLGSPMTRLSVKATSSSSVHYSPTPRLGVWEAAAQSSLGGSDLNSHTLNIPPTAVIKQLTGAYSSNGEVPIAPRWRN